MKELNKLQINVLNLFSKSALKNRFYWTGGTMLSAIYLHHRKSLDLDFFSDQSFSHSEIIRFIRVLKEKLKLTKIEEKKIYDRWEFFLYNKEELRLEFVHYDFPRLQKRKQWKGISIDSLDDISANKLMAFFDRNDPKDLFDLYFLLVKKKYQIKKLLKLVERKFGVSFEKSAVYSEAHKALDDLDNLRPLLLTENNREAAKLIKDIKDYFINHSNNLISRLLSE